jgi:DNA-binding IclR family transcriptional regulator
MTADVNTEDRLFVTALARGLSVLAAFKPGDQLLGNLELAKRTGLPKSTVARLTHTLTMLGYLIQDGSGGKYRPGPSVLTLGYAALSQFDIRDRARPLMRQLSDETGLSVTLASRQGTRMVYIEACRAPTRVGVHLDVGASVPIATTAIGRACWSGMAPETRSVLKASLSQEYAERWHSVEAGMLKAEMDLSHNGFCVSFGDYESDIFAVAVPLRYRDVELALNCSGPAYRLTRSQWINDIAPRLMAMAEKLSQQ